MLAVCWFRAESMWSLPFLQIKMSFQIFLEEGRLSDLNFSCTGERFDSRL